MPRQNSAANRLRDYRAKRDFTKSPEPSGNAATAKAKTRARRAKPAPMFCVQKHLASHLHYDLRLEHDGTLLSWAVPKGPSLNPADKRLAVRVEDHPLDYGEFEGVIPAGYGAGLVMLWDRGTWAPNDPDVGRALARGELKFSLDGVKLKGGWVLVRTGDTRNWLLIKHRDDWSGGDVDVTEAAPLSVKTFVDFPAILAAEGEPEEWQTAPPARGGFAGAMLTRVRNQAAAEAKRKPRAKQPRARRAKR